MPIKIKLGLFATWLFSEVEREESAGGIRGDRVTALFGARRA
jgi:hypothetical protein